MATRKGRWPQQMWSCWNRAAVQHKQEDCMSRPKKSFRLELTKEQQALILQNTGVKTKELELQENALKTQTEPKRDGNQP
jgi:hypothetical protein